MKNQISYEWDVEELDDNGEILDHVWRDKLSDFRSPAFECRHALVLVRDEGNEFEGLQERFWAYEEGGKLPEFFSDTQRETRIRVPERFHAELKKFLAL